MTTKNIKRHDFTRILDLIKHSKLKLILIGTLCLVMLFTGIIVAIKGCDNCDGVELFDFCSFGSSFWGRLLSMVLVALICFGCSFTKWLFPLALLFLSYRGYLLGLNLALIIACNGFVGIVAAVLVILPCQLCVIALISLMYAALCKIRAECIKGKEMFLIFIISLVLLLAVCLIETILFALFSPNIILIV